MAISEDAMQELRQICPGAQEMPEGGISPINLHGRFSVTVLEKIYSPSPEPFARISRSPPADPRSNVWSELKHANR